MVADRVAAKVELHDRRVRWSRWEGDGAPQRRSWRMVTLTLPLDTQRRSDVARMRADVLAIRAAWRAWWRLTPWGRQSRFPDSNGRKRSRRDTGYVLGLEIAPGGMVHIHAAVFGEFVAQDRLASWWARALGRRALVDVRTIRTAGGIAKALREVLKYATKGEKGTRDPERAASVELALRNTRRVEQGGSLRRIKSAELNPTATDLLDAENTGCEECGSVGEWHYCGRAGAWYVEASGGFGPLARSQLDGLLSR